MRMLFCSLLAAVAMHQSVALADCATYNHYRHAVLSFLYEKQRKVEVLAKAEPAKTPAVAQAQEKRA